MELLDYGPRPANATITNSEYMPPELRGLYREAFTYTVAFPSMISRAGAQQQSTNVRNDSFFVCTHQSFQLIRNPAGFVISPFIVPVFVRIQDSAVGRWTSSDPVPLTTLFGPGQGQQNSGSSMPFVYWARGMVFRPGGQITVEASANFPASVGTSVTARFSFHGFRVFKLLDA